MSGELISMKRRECDEDSRLYGESLQSYFRGRLLPSSREVGRDKGDQQAKHSMTLPRIRGLFPLKPNTARARGRNPGNAFLRGKQLDAGESHEQNVHRYSRDAMPSTKQHTTWGGLVKPPRTPKGGESGK